ncbi:DsbA family oxidoreductase [Halobellus salinisoli]|uniref:DsbA family oxidoreductase n=1 Tax=Halobellus salinisoli TaxID=3108500 RepID=UPI00300816DC
MTDATNETTESETDRITIYSDYVCPFCYLGRESLSTYQAERDEDLEIDWRPFDLRSGKRNADGTIDHGADDGKDDAYYEQAKANVKKLREKYGADEMDVELATDVDSLPAQLVSVAIRERYDYETWLGFDEGVFAALWHDGRDIGEEEVLVDIAENAGVDADVVRNALADDDRRAALREQFREAQQRRITGVPTFVYDDHAARGAVPPEQLERLVEGV